MTKREAALAAILQDATDPRLTDAYVRGQVARVAREALLPLTEEESLALDHECTAYTARRWDAVPDDAKRTLRLDRDLTTMFYKIQFWRALAKGAEPPTPQQTKRESDEETATS